MFNISIILTNISFLCLLLLSCQQKTSSDITQIDRYIENDNYKQALTYLNSIESTLSSKGKIDTLRMKIHLNYGLYLKYRAEDKNMRERMIGALQEFVKVLQIDSQEGVSRKEAIQILEIYRTFPDRHPPNDLINDLAILGIEY